MHENIVNFLLVNAFREYSMLLYYKIYINNFWLKSASFQKLASSFKKWQRQRLPELIVENHIWTVRQ